MSQATVTTLQDAKTNLSDLLEKAAAGEEIIISKDGVPRARLVPLAADDPKLRFGGWEGKVRFRGEFDEPLPDDMLDAFEGRNDPS
jgi:prevent-host-death family protein